MKNSIPTFKKVFIVAIFFAISIVFPVVGWISLMFTLHPLESLTGVTVPLNAEPGGIDPGAVLVALIYVSLSGLLVKHFVARGEQVLAVIVGISTMCLSVYVFGIVSSLIWF